MEGDLPVPPAVAWAYVTDVERKIRWQQGLDRMTMTGLVGGRVVPGAVQHCAHGKDSTVHEIVDWRPFDYVIWHIGTPMGTLACTAKVESANPLAQAFVRFVMPLAAAKKLAETQRASQAALQRLVAEETKGAAQTAA